MQPCPNVSWNKCYNDWADLICYRVDQQQNGWMVQKQIQDEEKEELRMWMRKKQRERLADYQKHRESLREKEHKPFSSTVTVVRTISNILCQSWYLYTSRFQRYYIIIVPLQKPKSKNPAAIQKTIVEKQKYVQFLSIRGQNI